MDLATFKTIAKCLVELIAASAMIYGIYVVYQNRKDNARLKAANSNAGAELKAPSGIGARQIQFVTVTMLLPIVLILGLESKLPGESLGTLLGALAGYLLSRIGDYDLKKDNTN